MDQKEFADIPYLISLSKEGLKRCDKFEELIKTEFGNLVSTYRFLNKYYDGVTEGINFVLRSHLDLFCIKQFAEDYCNATKELLGDESINCEIRLTDEETIKDSVMGMDEKVTFNKFLKFAKHADKKYDEFHEKMADILEEENNYYEEWHWAFEELLKTSAIINEEGQLGLKIPTKDADDVVEYIQQHIKVNNFIMKYDACLEKHLHLDEIEEELEEKEATLGEIETVITGDDCKELLEYLCEKESDEGLGEVETEITENDCKELLKDLQKKQTEQNVNKDTKNDDTMENEGK